MSLQRILASAVLNTIGLSVISVITSKFLGMKISLSDSIFLLVKVRITFAVLALRFTIKGAINRSNNASSVVSLISILSIYVPKTRLILPKTLANTE